MTSPDKPEDEAKPGRLTHDLNEKWQKAMGLLRQNTMEGIDTRRAEMLQVSGLNDATLDRRLEKAEAANRIVKVRGGYRAILQPVNKVRKETVQKAIRIWVHRGAGKAEKSAYMDVEMASEPTEPSTDRDMAVSSILNLTWPQELIQPLTPSTAKANNIPFLAGYKYPLMNDPETLKSEIYRALQAHYRPLWDKRQLLLRMFSRLREVELGGGKITEKDWKAFDGEYSKLVSLFEENITEIHFDALQVA